MAAVETLFPEHYVYRRRRVQRSRKASFNVHRSGAVFMYHTRELAALSQSAGCVYRINVTLKDK